MAGHDQKNRMNLYRDDLFLAVLTAIGSYGDLYNFDEGGIQLEQMIESAKHIYTENQMYTFSAQVIRQLLSIVCLGNKKEEKMISGFVASKMDGMYMITYGIGSYQAYEKLILNDVIPLSIQTSITKNWENGKSKYTDNTLMLLFNHDFGTDNIIFIESQKYIGAWEKNLIQLFEVNLIEDYAKLCKLNRQRLNTEKLIQTLSEVIEAKTKEMNHHVRRVASYSKLLAQGCGLDEESIEILEVASMIHDIGKLTIPVSILNKPGRLSVEEFERVKKHAMSGYEMMKDSKNTLIQTAALIALEHHEKWNGTGYPSGLAKDEIHLYGRIVALADVFDALSTNRVYKKAWSIEQIIDLLHQERGEHFDPKLVDIMLENIHAFIHIRDGASTKVL
ncbi:HD domain-containing phosphohydrolase [Petrocella sp. FN5]|uniref:HD domain-containing phosphohydrolase n=1 Tax=Petrocella sp. FN5 TaxID=3032002 RepID=UPI0023DBFD4D|nr:HD domain-containing phosphohydrolase [Petrocella sp. FN5]MDF1617932.1 HD domain-containing protein [Petrocella sp. FN5]